MSFDIQSRATLVSLKICQWSARKYDRKVTREVQEAHNASADSGRYNKHLIPGDARTYKELISYLSAARATHYLQTLAWGDEGFRLLPITNDERYRAMVQAWKDQTSRLLAAFLEDYPTLRENARIRLNGMFEATDYPSVEELEKKFSIHAEYYPVPSGDDFRVTLAAGVQAEMERQLNERVERATENAMSDAWSRLYTCVEHLHERLAAPGAIFRDSLVTNVREVCDVLQRLNVTGSIELETMRARVQESLAQYDPNTLRDNDQVRANVAQTAGEILGAIRGTRRIQVVTPNESEVITTGK